MKRSPTLLIACLMLALLAATVTVLPAKAEGTTALTPDSTVGDTLPGSITTLMPDSSDVTTKTETTTAVTTTAVTTAETDAEDGGFNWMGVVIALVIVAALIILICALIPKRRPK